MSNYPPGVTGNEWQIAGPSAEWTEDRDVEHICTPDLDDDDPDFREFSGTVEVSCWGHTPPVYGFEWDCPTCGKTIEGEDEEEDPTDY